MKIVCLCSGSIDFKTKNDSKAIMAQNLQNVQSLIEKNSTEVGIRTTDLASVKSDYFELAKNALS